MLLYFRPRLLSVYASLAVRFSAGASLRLSLGHGSFDPLSWQGRFVRYPVGRIFSCCFGKKIPSLGRARERAFLYPSLKLFPYVQNGFSILRGRMTSPLTLYSTLFLSFSVCPHLYRNENRGLTPSSSKNSHNVYNLNAKTDPHSSRSKNKLSCSKAMWIGVDSKTISVCSPNGFMYGIQLSHLDDAQLLYRRHKNLSRPLKRKRLRRKALTYYG